MIISSRILVVIRGLPGSGKTHIAKLIKDKEVEMGGSAPRILSIDDYFTTETDEVTTCPTTGKDINLKSMVYEYEAEMEEQYLQYLLKAYKKTVSDGYFDFIVVDAVYPKMSSVLEIITHGKSKGFVVSRRDEGYQDLFAYNRVLVPLQSYICSLECDVAKCVEQNIHNRTEEELTELSKQWEKCPKDQLRLDIKPLIEWSQIRDLPVEDISDEDDVDMVENTEKREEKVEKSAEESKEEVMVKDDSAQVESVAPNANCTDMEGVKDTTAEGESIPKSDEGTVEVKETPEKETPETTANGNEGEVVPKTTEDDDSTDREIYAQVRY